MGSECSARKTARAGTNTAKKSRKNKHVSARSSKAGRAVAGALIAGAVVATAGIVAVPTLTAQPAQAATTVPAIKLIWSKTLPDAGKPVAKSSPMVATLDGGGSAVVVGDRAGHEYAYHLSNGSGLSGWPTNTGGVAVDSTASVLGSGSGARVFFGEGTSSNPSAGGYRALSSAGKTAWFVTPQAQPGKGTAGVMSSLAIGDMQSSGAGSSVVGGSMGQMQDLIDANTGRVGTGFPWFQADSNFTTPAVSSLGFRGKELIVEGGDSTAGVAYGVHYTNGGHIRLLNATGNHGSGTPGGGLRCQYNTTQVVQGSPAVGPFLGGGGWGVVVGTGSYYKGASDSNKVIAMDRSCHPIWKADLHGVTDSGPALADVKGTGHNWVIQASRGSSSSRVYALDGSSGKALWWTTVPGLAFGQVTTADLTGQGYQDVIVATTSGAFVIDGRTGHVVEKFAAGYGFQNSVLVTNDPNGSIGLTVAGYNGKNTGVILHYEIVNNAAATGSKVNVTGAWPMFHHDPQLTGDVRTVIPAKP